MVAGGLGDAQVELEVGVGGVVAAASRRPVIASSSASMRATWRVAAALGGERGGLRLEAHRGARAARAPRRAWTSSMLGDRKRRRTGAGSARARARTCRCRGASRRMPRARSCEIASRTTVRLTPNAPTRSPSLGSFAPWRCPAIRCGAQRRDHLLGEVGRVDGRRGSRVRDSWATHADASREPARNLAGGIDSGARGRCYTACTTSYKSACPVRVRFRFRSPVSIVCC